MTAQIHGGPHGWLNIYKPAGISSNKYINAVRRLAGKGTRVGHAGTLDPMADGVLPVAVGAATRLIPYCQEGVKTYVFTVSWGISTDTLDAEGAVTARSPAVPGAADIDAVLPGLTGEGVIQIPPVYSALKHQGKRLCDLARAGDVKTPQGRPVDIHSLKRIGGCASSAVFIAHCGKGTYVRAVARDICAALGVEGHVSRLTRVRYGNFFAESAFLLAPARQISYNRVFDARLLPPDCVLDDIPALQVNDGQARDLRDGKRLFPCPEGAPPEGEIAAMYCHNRFFALASRKDGALVPEKVFHLW